MMENEPGIEVRSVTESRRGPGIIIWIPGYIDNDGTIIVSGLTTANGAIEAQTLELAAEPIAE